MASISSILEDEILKTLSFIEPMSLEMIFLDFDKQFLLLNNELSYDDLLSSLKKLVKLKKIQLAPSDESQKYWIKVFPKRKWYKRL